MSASRFVVESLGSRHDRSAFSSGVSALDHYFRAQAGQDSRRRLASVVVLLDAETGGIAGFYTLSALQIDTVSLPPDLAKRLPRRPLPATLLGRLAVDSRYQGQGLGGRMLFHALARAYDASALVAAIGVVVDAKDEGARAFYERYGFARFVDDEFRLFIPMQSIAELFPDDGN